MADVQKKKITDLRVVDLRLELEKRGLDKAGNKSVLQERLKQALLSEGKNGEYIENSTEMEASDGKETQDSLNEDKSTIDEREILTDEIINESTNVSLKTLVGDGTTSGTGKSDEVKLSSEGVSPNQGETIQDVPKGNHECIITDTALQRNENEQDDSGVKRSRCDGGDESDNGTGDHSEGREEEEDAEMKQTSDNEENPGDEDSRGFDEDTGERTVVQDDEVSMDGSHRSGSNITKHTNNEKHGEDKDDVNHDNHESDSKLDHNEDKDVPCDDEGDQDALRLTIGEEEEEDKNYILADERDRENNDEPEKSQESSDQAQEKVSSTDEKTGSKPKSSSPKSGKAKSGAQQDHSGEKGQNSKNDQTRKSNVGNEKKPKRDNTADAAGTAAKKDTEKGGDKKNTKTGPREGHNPPQKSEPRVRTVRRFDRSRMPIERIRRSLSPRSRRAPPAPNHRQNLSFEHIREMRERERQREREREMHRRMREKERKEREALARQREIERRNAEQLEQLERERQRLRIEREKVEREKEELIRMERERQRAERERIEREKEEIRKAKLDERRRSHKRVYEDDRKESGSRSYGERDKKRVSLDSRRPERPVFNESRSYESSRTAPRDRDRDRAHPRRSKSRSASPGRHTSHRREVSRAVAYPERGAESQEWRYDDSRRDPHYRAKDAHKPYPEVPKDKRPEERRDVRIAREREVHVSSTSSVRPAADYSRNEPVLATRRTATVPTSKTRSDRYEPGKGDPYTATKDDSWTRRPSYVSSAIPSTSFSSSQSSREWIDRKDYVTSDRLPVRSSLSDSADRWISGSGSTVPSGRSAISIDHMPQAPPPPSFSHSMGSGVSGGGSMRIYPSDPYAAGAYSSKSRFPSQRY